MNPDEMLKASKLE